MPKHSQTSASPSPSGHRLVIDVAVALAVDNLSITHLHRARRGPTHTPPHPKDDTCHLLISRRRTEQVLGGYWELPGGKVEPNETPTQAVVRELKEEVGINALPCVQLPIVEHTYDYAHVRLHPFICKHLDGTASAIEVDTIRWVTPSELSNYRFPKATLPVLDAFQDWLSNPDRTAHH